MLRWTSYQYQCYRVPGIYSRAEFLLIVVHLYAWHTHQHIRYRTYCTSYGTPVWYDQLVHSTAVRSCPPQNGFTVVSARGAIERLGERLCMTLLTLVCTYCLPVASTNGSRRPISFHADMHTPQHARSEYYTQLAKMIFDKIFDLTAEVFFYFFDIPG